MTHQSKLVPAGFSALRRLLHQLRHHSLNQLQHPLPLTRPHDVPCDNGNPAVYPMTVRVMTSLLEEAAAAPTDHPIHAHLDDLRMRLETYVDGGTARAVQIAPAIAVDDIAPVAADGGGQPSKRGR